MLITIKNKTKEFVDQRIKEILRYQNDAQQIALDYAQISRLFPESNFISFTSWSISPSVVLHILNDIVINNRQNIIEFGAGITTLYIARLIQTLKLDIKFYSIESNEDWLIKINNELEFYNLQHIVTLIHAPQKIVPKNFCLKGQTLWYDIEKITAVLGDHQELDLIIVDGPNGKSTPFARYSAIPFLQTRLSKNFGVFLDDAQRKDEREISIQWSKLLLIDPKYIQRYVYFASDTSFITTPFKL